MVQPHRARPVRYAHELYHVEIRLWGAIAEELRTASVHQLHRIVCVRMGQLGFHGTDFRGTLNWGNFIEIFRPNLVKVNT
jgi:hypothetical protein